MLFQGQQSFQKTAIKVLYSHFFEIFQLIHKHCNDWQQNEFFKRLMSVTSPTTPHASLAQFRYFQNEKIEVKMGMILSLKRLILVLHHIFDPLETYLISQLLRNHLCLFQYRFSRELLHVRWIAVLTQGSFDDYL